MGTQVNQTFCCVLPNFSAFFFFCLFVRNFSFIKFSCFSAQPHVCICACVCVWVQTGCCRRYEQFLSGIYPSLSCENATASGPETKLLATEPSNMARMYLGALDTLITSQLALTSLFTTLSSSISFMNQAAKSG